LIAEFKMRLFGLFAWAAFCLSSMALKTLKVFSL
jgi:hypothetical protein